MGVPLTFNRAELKFCDKGRHYNSVDLISQLPDEILVLILSVLTVREAVVTSILSSRWRHLWKSITRLDFDATKTLGKIGRQCDLLEVERPQYVEWVNQVIRLHKCSTLDELRIHFDLDKIYGHVIDEWIKFAITKRVQRLELDLSFRFRVHTRQCSISYTFPSRLLGPCNSNFPGMLPSTFVAFKSLKALYLKSVRLTVEDFLYFLSHCPVLERLSMQGSEGLESLRVAGLALTLKYLEIKYCSSLKTIEIRDTNLVSFNFMGRKIRLLLANVPHLVEVHISGSYVEIVNDVFDQLSYCLSQLRTLTLTFPSLVKRITELKACPRLIKLQELVYDIIVDDDESLLGYISLIQSSPHLQRFVLKLEWIKPITTRSEVWKSVKFSHQYLKVVELAGYYGGTSDFELAMYFIENAVALEKIIIDPRCQFQEQHLIKFDMSDEQAARCRAHQQLEGKLPPEVKLVIL